MRHYAFNCLPGVYKKLQGFRDVFIKHVALFYRKAVGDGKRAILLKPLWAKVFILSSASNLALTTVTDPTIHTQTLLCIFIYIML